MTVSSSAPLVLATLAGAAFAFVATWFLALAPLRREVVRSRERACDVSDALNGLRVEFATVSAREDAATRAHDGVLAGLAAADSGAAALRARVSELELVLAVERRSSEALRENEADVNARFQRVAKAYVDDAQRQLLASTAERFDGNAAALRAGIDATVAPLQERLTALDGALAKLGTTRAADDARIATLFEGLTGKMTGIDDATRRVERVLGNSQARGSWGEHELQRLLEMTGMTQHVSFHVQQGGYGVDGTGRPDVIVRIPNDLFVPIDSKCPFDSYQAAVCAVTDAERERHLKAAVDAVRSHVKALSSRRYHDGERSVGWTIMFVPIEAMLSTLFAREPDVFEVARKSRILVASPLTLLFYLEAFSRGWSVQKQSENADAIFREARELIKRLSTYTDKYAKVGTKLESALEAYNDSVSTYEGRLGPQARKIVELQGDVPETAVLERKRTNVRHIDASRLPAPVSAFDGLPLGTLRPVDVRAVDPADEREAG